MCVGGKKQHPKILICAHSKHESVAGVQLFTCYDDIATLGLSGALISLTSSGLGGLNPIRSFNCPCSNRKESAWTCCQADSRRWIWILSFRRNSCAGAKLGGEVSRSLWGQGCKKLSLSKVLVSTETASLPSHFFISFHLSQLLPAVLASDVRGPDSSDSSFSSNWGNFWHSIHACLAAKTFSAGGKSVAIYSTKSAPKSKGEPASERAEQGLTP